VRKQRVHAAQVGGTRLVDELVKALVDQRLRVRRQQRRVHRREQRLARGRVEVGVDAAALVGDARLDVQQVVGEGGGGEEAGGLGGVEDSRALEQRPLEPLGVHLQRGQHSDQVVEQRAVDLLARPLALDLQQQRADGLGEHVGEGEEVVTEVLQPHVPQRAHPRRLQRVGPVEEEEDGADHQRLLAVLRPHAVHRGEEGGGLGGRADECSKGGLGVPLALLLQPRVCARRHLVRAQVLDRTVELLERRLDRLLRVDRADGGLELAPGGELKVGGQRRRAERLDHQLLRRGVRLPRAHRASVAARARSRHLAPPRWG
jgi:hypothetical protein